jgi:hypothetical protein
MSKEPLTDHDALITLIADVKYVRESLDEIKAVVKDFPTYRQKLEDHVDEHKRKEAEHGIIITAISTVIASIIARFSR